MLVGTRGDVSVWDPATGAGVAALPKGRDSGQPLIASKDGSRVAVATNEGFVFYDVASQKALVEVAVDDAFAPIAMGPKGELAAIGGDRQVRLIDLGLGKEIDPIRGLSEDPLLLAVHPNGRILAVGLTNETQFWDLGRLPQPPRLALREPGISPSSSGNLEFIANGKALLGTEGGQPKVWDASTKKMRPDVEGSLRTAVAAEDGSVFVMHARDGRTLVVDGASHRVRTVLEAKVPPGKTQQNAGASGAYAVSSDGGTICIGLKTGDVEIHSSSGEAAVEESASYDVAVHAESYGSQSIDILPIGERLLFSNGNQTALIDRKTGAASILEDPSSERSFGLDTWFVGRTERRLIAPRRNGKLLKFDLTSGKGEVAGTPRRFYSVSASPDGTKVAAVMESPSGAAQLVSLDAANGSALGEPLLTDAEPDVRAKFAWSADGSKLAVCIGRKPRLWDLATREETALDADGDWRRIFFVDEGRTLALVDSRVLRLVDLETGQLKTELELARFHTGRVFDAAVSPTDPILASVGDAGEVLLRDLETGDVLGRAIGHDKTVLAVSFDADGKRLATIEDVAEPAAREGLVRIKTWAIDAAKLKATPKGDLATDLPKREPAAPAPSPKRLAEPKKLVEFDCLIDQDSYSHLWFSPDRKLLLAGSGRDNYASGVQGLDLTSGESRFALEKSTGSEMVFSPDSKFAFTYVGSRDAYSIDLATGKITTSDGGAHCLGTQRAIASTDDASFVVGLRAEERTPIAEPALLKLDRTDPKTVLAQWDVRNASVRDIAQLPDGTLLVSLSERSEKTKVLFFDPERLEVVGTLYEGKGTFGPRLILSPDGKRAALEDAGIWSVDREAPRLLADEATLPSECVGFLADTGLSIHDQGYRNYCLFDPVTRTVRRKIVFADLAGSDRIESRIVFSRDGRLMAWGTSDGEVAILDLASGVNPPPRKLHDDKIYAVRFSDDGTRLAAACADGKIAVWSLDGSESAASD